MTPGTDPSFRSYNKFRICSHQNIKEEIKYSIKILQYRKRSFLEKEVCC